MDAKPRRERFADLLSDHKNILYKVCSAYCRNPADRDDLAQEIAIQLWRSFGSFDDRYRFSTWMYRVSINVAISFYRREANRARHVLSGDDRLIEIPDRVERPPEDVLLLYQFIDGLDALNKALILLSLDGYGYREIAGVVGISETNVATKLSRLKQAMKRDLAGAVRQEKDAETT
jgi:RNA polymerase sigma-70 factor (ECF subfamily)